MCVSHFPQFSFFSSYSRSYSVHFSFSPFLSVSLQFSLNSVCVSFSTFFSYLAISQVLQWVFLNLHLFQYFLPNSRTYSVRVSFSTFFSFFAKFHFLQWVFLNLHIFQCLLSYSDIHFSCLIIHVIQFSPHFPGHRVFVSHFPSFSFSSP